MSSFACTIDSAGYEISVYNLLPKWTSDSQFNLSCFEQQITMAIGHTYCWIIVTVL